MDHDKSNFRSSPGSMLNFFVESSLLEKITEIQRNENLNDEREVIIRAIQNYYKKTISDYARPQEQFEDELPRTTFDGSVDIERLEELLAEIGPENFIEKLPQHQIYNSLKSAGMMHRLHTKILPVKFSLLCLSTMIVEQNNPWVDLNDLKSYALESARIFIKNFESSPIRNKFKIKSGFPMSKSGDLKTDHDSYLLYIRSSKRFTEEFIGRKLQKRNGIQIGGACFEMGLILAKVTNYDEKKNSGKIYVTLSESGKEFVSYKNRIIDFVYGHLQEEPSSIFTQQERGFYFRKILPEFKFENEFAEYLTGLERIKKTSDIKDDFTEQFGKWCKKEFSDRDVSLDPNTVRIYSNNIMNRLMEFGVFSKDPKSRSGPYTRIKSLNDMA